MQVAVVDTGVGNVESVLRACRRAALDAGVDAALRLTGDPEHVLRADALVVPGQGSFAAFARAAESGLREALITRIRGGAPYLGICLGMQALFTSSEEAPGAAGLGIFEGTVRKIAAGVDPQTGRARPLPHMGWNVVTATPPPHPALPARPTHFFFAHSFAVAPADRELVKGEAEYGERVVAVVAKDNVLGVQFHPEKSQAAGLALLARFFRGAR